MPNVVVTFYKNFRFEKVDISGVQFGLGGTSTEPRTGKRIGGTKPGTFPMDAHYAYFPVKVVASGGTYRLKIKLGGIDYESSDIAYNANAAAVAAAFSPPPGIGDPGTPIFEPCGESGGETVYCAIAGTWINVHDTGPGEYEVRYFEDSGVHSPAGVSILAVGVALGAVIVEVPKYDEVKYTVPLEEGDCGGGAPPPPPPSIEPLGASSGAKEHPRPISGNGQ